MKHLAGLIVTHQCEEFDYCYREAIQSLIDTCDEVIVVDGKSTDGTRDVLATYERINVKVIDADWNPVPGTRGAWLADLYNLAKEKASCPFTIGLQADEVLHEIDREEIRRWKEQTSLRRLNFWKDAQHFLPNGAVCGSRVFRFGNGRTRFSGDAESMDPSVPRKNSQVCIFHYGFLRRTTALIDKCISFETEVLGEHNELFDRMKTEGRRPFDEFYGDGLLPYEGSHPKYAQMWLEDRGYDSGMYIAARPITQFVKPEWTGVEIGVFMGDSSRLLLRHCRFMYLIDPCESYDGNPDVGVYSIEEGVRAKLKGSEGRYEFIKGMSHDVHERIPEVDFVFIDGNHTYPYVSRDIDFYWPNVRSGGFISGHDYGAGFPDVIRAVNEFSTRAQLPLEIHGDCWMIRKP